MMTRSEILQATKQAKIAHKRWVKRAEHLILGLPVDKEFIPLETTSCDFGKWLYSQGSQLRTIDATSAIIEKIEHYHDELHDAYKEIYTIYFVNTQNRSFLTKILTLNNKKVTPKEKESAKEHMKELNVSSKKLLNLIDRLENASAGISYDELGI